MIFSWPIFAVGLILGVLQLGVGVIIGRAVLPSRAKSDTDEPPEVVEIRQAAGRLHRLVTRLSDDVGRHQVRIEQLTKDVSSLRADAPNLRQLVIDNVALVTQANRQLQSRLAEAEQSLSERAQRLDALTGSVRALSPPTADVPDPTDLDLGVICRSVHDRLEQVTAEG